MIIIGILLWAALVLVFVSYHIMRRMTGNTAIVVESDSKSVDYGILHSNYPHEEIIALMDSESRKEFHSKRS